MANEVPRIYRTQVTVQASAAITAGSFSAGAQTAIDNTLTGNGGGCDLIKLMLDVTVAPLGTTDVEVYMSTSDDDATYTEERLIKTVSVPASTGQHQAGIVLYPEKYTKFRIKAIDYDLTASLAARPQLSEIQ